MAKRTPTSRPCLVWPAHDPELKMQGVVTDVNPFGMLIRMLEPVAVGTEVRVQLMRDDRYQEALAAPVEGWIVRHAGAEGLFTDHGVRLDRKEVRRNAAVAARPAARPAAPTRTRARMHTIDITVTDAGIRRKR